MRHSEQMKMQARDLYANGFNFKEIAEQLQVNAKTVSSWKTPDWETLRAMQSYRDVEYLARELVEQLLLKGKIALQRLDSENLEGVEIVQQFGLLSESLARAVNASKKLSPEVNVKTVKYETLYELSEFVKQHHPEHLKALIPCIEQFLEEI